MLHRINPGEIIRSHFATFYDYGSNTVCRGEIIFQLGLAALLAVIHFKNFTVDVNTVGIIVSVASIVAGLLLNLMVLVYSLLTSKVDSSKTTLSNHEDFKEVCKEALSNIAFSVLVCIVLVVSALMTLTDAFYINVVGHLVLIFSGTILILTIMIVLIRFYRLITSSIKVS